MTISLNILKYFAFAVLMLTAIWCTGAVYYTVNWHGIFRITGSAGFFMICGFLIFKAWHGDIFPALDLLVIEILVIILFSMLTPRERFAGTQWQTPWGRRPNVIFDGNIARISDVRDFVYFSENNYLVRYKDVEIDMDKVCHIDLAVSHWDGLDSVAHTMLSFVFSDGKHLAFSMETRLPAGAKQGMIPGMYKQYELLPVIATEEDLFKLRTNFRKEELFLYRTNATKEQCRLILKTLLASIAEQYRSPRFYNSLTSNCTTSLSPVLRWIDPGFTGDIRLLFNGYSDELLFDLGYLAHREGETFPQLKERRRVSKYLQCDQNYSRAIRTNL